MKTIPTSAFLLGWAGGLPFAALSVLTLSGGSPWFGVDPLRTLQALITCGMIILSFMCGVQWGFEMTSPDGDGALAPASGRGPP